MVSVAPNETETTSSSRRQSSIRTISHTSCPLAAANSLGCTVQHTIEKQRKLSIVPIGGAWRGAVSEGTTRTMSISSLPDEHHELAKALRVAETGYTMDKRRRKCKIALASAGFIVALLIVATIVLVPVVISIH
ncbi:hypothetical protein Tcan_08615 [Toxocara canis]|uniref:Uncharacterized protein n=1 Tax=Toxocara canis TaxID=6265 RepID=A0A0B2VFR9_TOXCA|nr:hypothetical protein Tcan_08615 [Toxocara canis]